VRIRHVAALDGLRGIAVAGVVLFHGGHLTGGYLGVDLFFVLSGFLITTLLLTEAHDTDHIRLGSFWARRARRLLPALFGVLAGIAAYCVFFAAPTELAQIRGDALATLGYVANWRFVLAGQDYWALFRSPSPLEHTWSLAIEEQFYLIWPLVFVALLAWWKRNTPRAVLVTALVLAAVSYTLMVVLADPANPSRAYYGTDTRAGGVLLGAALAAALTIWGPATRRGPRIATEIAGLTGIAVLAVTWTTLDGQSSTLYHGGFLLAALATIAVLAAATNPRRGPISHTLAWKPLCLLGLISYGVYLWHWPVDVALNTHRTGLTGWPLFTAQTLATLAIATASYHLLEAPIRHGAGTKRQWQLATPLALTALLTAIVLTTTDARPAPVAAAAGTTGAADVVVIGDSVAGTVVPGLEHAGFSVKNGSLVGSRLVTGEFRTATATTDTTDWIAAWADLAAGASPRVAVLVTGTWDLFDVRPPGRTGWLRPGTPAWAAYYRARLVRATQLLHDSADTVIVPTIPYLGTGPLRDQLPVTKRSAFNPDRVRAANAVITALARERPDLVVTPDLNRFLSPEGHYQRGLRGVDPMRVDGVHLSPAGSDMVGEFLAPWVERGGAPRHPTGVTGRG
jgi:peptidoglycan/LPS O-acetylase OafA/YrhL/lysophospholipase L1-like esterase